MRSRGLLQILLVSMVIGLGSTPVASAYEVEADSVTNTVFVLLRNLHPTADFLSVSVGEDLPSIVSLANATIIPASVAASGSALAAVEFDVAAGAVIGEMGDLTLTITGTAAGNSLDILLTVPLEVVATVPEAQGEVGVGIPAPDPGGTDTDGDGVTDAHEVAFGSDPISAGSVPGKFALDDLPALGMLGVALLAALVIFSGARLARSQRTAGVS
jgi:hypothetical protein